MGNRYLLRTKDNTLMKRKSKRGREFLTICLRGFLLRKKRSWFQDFPSHLFQQMDRILEFKQDHNHSSQLYLMTKSSNKLSRMLR